MNSALQTAITLDTTDAMDQATHGLQIVGVETQTIVERRPTSIAQIAAEKSAKPSKRTNQRTCRMTMASLSKITKSQQDFRVLQTENTSMNMLVAAKNVESGLNKGETVVLVTEERPDIIERKFTMMNVDVKTAMENGQLVIISMNQTQQDAYEMPVAASYKQMFSDLESYAGKRIGRIVVLELDQYLDLETEYRALQSMEEFHSAAAVVDCPVLTQVVHNDSDASELLVKVSREVTSRFFSLVKDNDQLRLSSKETMH